MTNELEKQFFDTFGIECNISYPQQFNCAQIPRGLEFYKEREKLEKEGIIKIWHKMLNPRPENDCIYWGEYHYPQITDSILLKLICIIGDVSIKCTKNKCEVIYSDGAISYLGKDLKEALLNLLISKVLIFKCQVRTLFEDV